MLKGLGKRRKLFYFETTGFIGVSTKNLVICWRRCSLLARASLHIRRNHVICFEKFYPGSA